MGLSNGILSAPVKLSEVKTCLNATNTSLKELCNHSNINMWAKYKPVSHTSAGGITSNERFSNGYGINGVYYDVYSLSGREMMITDAKQGKFGWTYERPGNGICRLRDFEGYNHNAVFPFTCSCSNNATTGSVSIAQIANLPSGNITVSDLTTMVGQANSDTFTAGGYGVVYKKSGGSANYIDAVDSSGFVIHPISSPQTIDFTQSAGTYDVCIYITKGGNASQGFIIPGSYFSVTVKSSGGGTTDKVVLTGFNVTSTSKPVFSFDVINTSGSSLSAGTAVIKIYMNSNQNTEDDLVEVYVPSLADGERREVESDRYEGGIDLPSASHWTVTYQGVTSSKQYF